MKGFLPPPLLSPPFLSFTWRGTLCPSRPCSSPVGSLRRAVRAKGLAPQPRCSGRWAFFSSAADLVAPAPPRASSGGRAIFPCRLAVPWLLLPCPWRAHTACGGVAGSPCKVAWASPSEPGTRRCAAGAGSRPLKSLPTCLLSDRAGVLREMAGPRGSPPLGPLPSLALVPQLFAHVHPADELFPHTQTFFVA